MTKTTAAAIAIWVVGAWLRLAGLQAMEFKSDERTSLELSIQLLADHPWSSSAPWPSHGLISSNHIGNAPLFIWIVAPLWALTHDPVGVTALIAVINALCLLPLWFWARRRMDEERALVTLAIAAVSPFTVLYSRKIWPVDLLLPGMLAVLWSVEWFREGRCWRALALAGAAVLLITQLHQSGIITAPLLLTAFAVQWAVDARRGHVIHIARPSLPEIVAIVIVVTANVFFWWTYLPYFRTIPAEALVLRPQATSYAPQLLFNVIWEVIPRHALRPFYEEHIAFLADWWRGTVYYMSLALGAPLALYGVWRWLRAPVTLPVVGIWWWLVIVAFAAAKIPSHDHYVLALMPLPVLLASGAFDGRLSPAWARALRVWRWTYVVALLALTLVAGTWLMSRGGSRGDYGITFEIQRAQAQALLGDLRGERRTPNPALAEAGPEVAAPPRCRRPSDEILWIARWLDARTDLQASRVQICDGWTDTGEDASYCWAIVRAP